jgi:anti-anti-sigma factor
VASPAERSASRFHVGAEDLDEAIVVTIAGEIDAANVRAIAGALDQAMAHGRPKLVIDMRRVSYLDSLAITVLAQCFDRARERGIAVAAICNERTAALLESLGLDAEVAVVGTRDQALESLAAPVAPAPAAPAAEPPYRATLRSARELIERGGVPADEQELALLRRALEEAPPPAGD